MSVGTCNSTVCPRSTAADQAVTTSNSLIPADIYDILLLVNSGIFWVTLSILGIISNTTNLVVFKRMGFAETANISLFALALSDLMSLVFLLWVGILLNPYWKNVDLPFNPVDMGSLTGGWPHVICIRVTGWLTALVSFERFMCIAKPLEVKMIFTPLRVKITIATIYLVNLVPPLAIVVYTHRLTLAPINNGSARFLTMGYSQDRDKIESISNIFTQNLSPLLTFAMVVAPTIGLVIKLNEKKNWRDGAATTPKNSISSKDSRAAKMVTIVSVIYIICFTPTIITFIVWVIYPVEFHWTGKLHDVFFVCFGITFILEGINSNANFIIYYKMSTKFKQTFQELIGIETKT